jgi:hypothetical protein
LTLGASARWRTMARRRRAARRSTRLMPISRYSTGPAAGSAMITSTQIDAERESRL